MSRSVTGSVDSWPCSTLPSESPISSVSTPRLLEHGGEARVVAGEHRDLVAVLRHLLQRAERDSHAASFAVATRGGLSYMVPDALRAQAEELARAAHARLCARNKQLKIARLIDES